MTHTTNFRGQVVLPEDPNDDYWVHPMARHVTDAAPDANALGTGANPATQPEDYGDDLDGWQRGDPV